MKTDLYLDNTGESFSRAHMEAELAEIKNILSGLVAWCTFIGQPNSHTEEKAAAHLATIRASLERGVELLAEFNVEAPVESLEERLTRLFRIIQGAFYSAGDSRDYNPLKMIGGSQTIKELRETLESLKDKLLCVIPDTSAMASDFMKHGRILEFNYDFYEGPEKPEDTPRSILASAVQRELEKWPEPPGGWTEESIQRALFPEFGETSQPAGAGWEVSDLTMAALKTLSQQPEPPGGWTMADIKIALSKEIKREVGNRPCTEKDIEMIKSLVDLQHKGR